MAKAIDIGRSAVWNWAAFAVSAGVAFFLSPFVVHKLGNLGYGVWTLVNSVIAYMGILDLGLRGGVTRFVSRHHAGGEHGESGRIVSAAFWLRSWIGALVVLASVVLAAVAGSVFQIPPAMQASARLSIIVLGVSFAITLTCGVFGAVLAAVNRFDLLNAVQILRVVLRVAGIVWALNSGYGIVALAVWELLVAVIANVAVIALALREYREIRLVFRRPEWSILSQLWGYSVFLLIFNSAYQVIYYTDNLVVGAFISAAAVTYYAIAGGLLEYARQIVSGLGIVLFPVASSLDAEGRQDQLRRLVIQGTRATLLLALPVQVTLFFRGQTFIALWIGAEHAQVAGGILRILVLAHMFALANYTSYNVVCGMGKHKPVALFSSCEAAANFILSVVLVRHIGLAGVAWGTVIPSVAIHVLFWPRYISSILNMPVWEYLWQGWIRSGLAVIPFSFASFLAESLWPASSLVQFGLQTAALLPVFAIGVCFAFRSELARQLRLHTNWMAA